MTQNLVPQILMQTGESFGRNVGQGLGEFLKRRRDEANLAKLLDALKGRGNPNLGLTTVPINGAPQPAAMGGPIDIGFAGDSMPPPAEGFAAGGEVIGPGDGTSDSVPANLSNGEVVIPAANVQQQGGPQAVMQQNGMSQQPADDGGGYDNLLSGLQQNPGAVSAPGFGQIMDIFEKRKKEADATATARKILKLNSKNWGIDDKDIQEMSGADARARVEAHVVTESEIGKHLINKVREQQSTLEQFKLRQMIAQAQQAPKFYGQINRAITPQPEVTDDAGDTSPATPGMPLGRAMMQAAIDNPAMMHDPEMIAMLKAHALDQQELVNGTFKVPETGAVFATRGKQMLPAGYTPEAGNQFQLAPVVAPGGELLGFNHTDRKGHDTFLKAPASAQLRQAKDDAGQPLKGIFVDAKGEVKNLRTEMEKMGDMSTAPEPESLWNKVKGIFDGDKPDAPAKGSKLTVDQAKAILSEVGGDKAKARALAQQRGYVF